MGGWPTTFNSYQSSMPSAGSTGTPGGGWNTVGAMSGMGGGMGGGMHPPTQNWMGMLPSDTRPGAGGYNAMQGAQFGGIDPTKVVDRSAGLVRPGHVGFNPNDPGWAGAYGGSVVDPANGLPWDWKGVNKNAGMQAFGNMQQKPGGFRPIPNPMNTPTPAPMAGQYGGSMGNMADILRQLGLI